MESYDVVIVDAGFVGSVRAKHLNHQYRVVAFDVNPHPLLLKSAKLSTECDVRQ